MDNKVKKLRLQRAWSQEQLAQLASLSTRTIQRIENNEMPSLETLSALAAVFNVSVADLTSESLPESDELDNRIDYARIRIKKEMRLMKSIIIAAIVCSVMYIANYIYTPDRNWPIWVVCIWGCILAFKAFKLFLIDKLINSWYKSRLTNLIKKNNL